MTQMSNQLLLDNIKIYEDYVVLFKTILKATRGISGECQELSSEPLKKTGKDVVEFLENIYDNVKDIANALEQHQKLLLKHSNDIKRKTITAELLGN